MSIYSELEKAFEAIEQIGYNKSGGKREPVYVTVGKYCSWWVGLLFDPEKSCWYNPDNKFPLKETPAEALYAAVNILEWERYKRERVEEDNKLMDEIEEEFENEQNR